MQNALDTLTHVVVGDFDSDTTIAYFAIKAKHDLGLPFEYTHLTMKIGYGICFRVIVWHIMTISILAMF